MTAGNNLNIVSGRDTTLTGAVIGSTADAGKNRLDTGTLGFGDIQNRAEYEVEHQSVGISTGGNIGSQFVGNMASSLLVGVNGKGSDGSTTKSAVSDGNIIIRDGDKQTQNVADLSRDVEHANQTLSPIFDKEKEQRRLQEAQKIGEIGSQAMDIARTQGDINGLTEAKKGFAPLKENATEKERQAYVDMLRGSDVYKAEMAKYGTGSAIQQGLQAATAAIQGLAGGDMAKAIAGGASPYLAEVIKQVAPDESSRVMAHAVVAGALAAVQGNSAAAGAAGAATTALMGEAIKNALYGDIPVSQLSEEQKQTLVALGTAAAGLAGGLTGGSSADAMTGAQAGQNEISNNMASIGLIQQMTAHAIMSSAAMAEAGSQNPDDQAALALTKAAKQGLSAACLANTSCVMMAIITAQSQPKAPSNTGGDQIADQSPTNTGGNQQVDPSISHTGNNQPSDQGATNTGNTDGALDVGGNATTTPVAEQNPDDLAYTSENSKYVPSPKHAAGGWGTPMDLSDSKAQEVLNNSIQGGKQKYGVSDGKIYEFQPDNVGGWHGYPVPGTEAPPKVLREFLARGDISKAEYNKMIKGK